MGSDGFESDVVRVAALREPVRRALYRFVAAQPAPVSRERAAAGVGVAHHIAKFHLDKLEEDGLLEVEYARPPGRGGPGAGRPAKLYRRSSRDIVVTLPERHYDLAARVMARAITAVERTGAPLAEAVSEAARDAGRALARRALATPEAVAPPEVVPRGMPDAVPQVVPEVTTEATPEVVTGILAGNGYEPRVESGRITLANCPFHSLARDHPALVCGMNLDLIDGLLGALPAADLRAELDPGPGRCCVVIAT